MSVSISYTIKQPSQSLNVSQEGRFIKIVERVFGSLPYTFDEQDLTKLQTLCDADGGDDEDTDWDRLIELINEHGKVEVCAE